MYSISIVESSGYHNGPCAQGWYEAVRGCFEVFLPGFCGLRFRPLRRAFGMPRRGSLVGSEVSRKCHEVLLEVLGSRGLEVSRKL